jgi:hypothetical protein
VLAYAETLTAVPSGEWGAFVADHVDARGLVTATTSDGPGSDPTTGPTSATLERDLARDEVRILVVDGIGGADAVVAAVRDALVGAGYTGQITTGTGPRFSQTTVLFAPGVQRTCEDVGAALAVARQEQVAMTPMTNVFLDAVPTAATVDCAFVLGRPADVGGPTNGPGGGRSGPG